MKVVLLAGSPSKESKTKILLRYFQNFLEKNNIASILIDVHDFSAESLLYAQYNDSKIQRFIDLIDKSDGIVIATPVYKASFSGALKTLLDILPEQVFLNKIVLPVATAGSHNHLLAIDYALKPVISILKAREILQGVFATDQQITYVDEYKQHGILDDVLSHRLQTSMDELLSALQRIKNSKTNQYEQQ